MLYYEVSPLVMTHAKESVLTYASSTPLATGQLVVVEVGKKQVGAVVVRKTTEPSFTTKQIIRTLENHPLPAPLVQLNDWMSRYYVTHPAHVWRTMLPSGLLKNRRQSSSSDTPPQRHTTALTLNPSQKQAIATILQKETGTHLLHGITGSGKTAVYIELAKHTVTAGRSVIILAPEIALTPQLIAEFTPHFSDVHVTHSTMTEAARHTLWRQILNSSTPQVIIGPRSALFMPVQDLGLIVIDECHEPAFKQDKSPRYSALRAAAVLSQFASARVVLGSATPLVTDYFLAQKTNAVVTMPHLARPHAVTPQTSLVDMTKKPEFSRSTFLSNTLLEAITATLADGHQALLFHNRRGSAPITLCDNCGWSATCQRCFVPLTLHADQFVLRCHLCNTTERIPTACPSCGRADIIHKGIGTKRIEEDIRKHFPHATVARFDGDAKDGVESSYQALYDGHIDIIIGTQVIAKGLDLPELRLVGVVQADSGLALPDYQSSERVFQLLSQVTGRVGRNEHPTRVIIQSYQPDHPSVQLGISQNYSAFYDWCLAERKRAMFPPYTHLLRLTAVYKTESAAVRAARSLAATLRRVLPTSVSLLGPAPAFYERVRDTYRWQIILKSPKRADLVAALELVPVQKWQSELDPISLL